MALRTQDLLKNRQPSMAIDPPVESPLNCTVFFGLKRLFCKKRGFQEEFCRALAPFPREICMESFGRINCRLIAKPGILRRLIFTARLVGGSPCLRVRIISRSPPRDRSSRTIIDGKPVPDRIVPGAEPDSAGNMFPPDMAGDLRQCPQ